VLRKAGNYTRQRPKSVEMQPREYIRYPFLFRSLCCFDARAHEPEGPHWGLNQFGLRKSNARPRPTRNNQRRGGDARSRGNPKREPPEVSEFNRFGGLRACRKPKVGPPMHSARPFGERLRWSGLPPSRVLILIDRLALRDVGPCRPNRNSVDKQIIRRAR
jgi:hypothetical protein